MSVYRAVAVDSMRKVRLGQDHLVFLYTVIAVLLPAAFAAASGGLKPLFHFLAADSFFYLSIAEHSRIGFYSFDGTNTTSGFHPLWQMTLQAMIQLLGLTGDKAHQIALSFWISVTLVATGSVFIAQTVLRWSGSVPAAMLTVPGVFGVLMMICGWQIGSIWHFINGMETPLSLFFFGLTIFYTSRQDVTALITSPGAKHRQLVVLSLLMAGIVLSRLDDFFLPAIIGVWLILRRGSTFSDRVKSAVWFGGPLGTVLAAYMLFNGIATGHPFPVSGQSKFAFDAAQNNFIYLLVAVCSLIPKALYNPFATDHGVMNFWFVNWRIAQLMLPALVAAVLLTLEYRLQRRARSVIPIWMRPLLGYVVIKALYNFFFVPLIHQGHWYFAGSIVVINMACAMTLAQIPNYWGVPKAVFERIALVTATAGLLIPMAVFVPAITAPSKYYEFFRRGPDIANALSARINNPRIIEADDGILSYSLGLPAISGFMFAIDREGYRSFRKGRFLSEAWARGYQLIGSLYYLRSFGPGDLTPEKIPRVLRRSLFFAKQWDIDDFDFSLAYRDPATGATFIRFEPKH